MKGLAPAKLNLTLRVVGRRADGYHLLESWMVFFPVYDTLEIQVTDGEWAMRCTPMVTEGIERNLVWRAARLLAERCGVTRGARIHLDKHIPHGAGLGGGSSDAALTLWMLNRLWDLNLPLTRLIELGVGLGADIPFFLGGHAALVEGVGERLTRFPTPLSGAAVVIFPGVPLATQAVFQQLAGRYPQRHTPLGWPAAGEEWIAGLENDLETPAMALCPEIAVARDALLAEGARVARMSGSGSTVFGLFAGEPQARQVAARLERMHADWRVYAGPLLPLHPMMEHDAG